MPRGRSYEDEIQYIERLSQNSFRIKKGFVPNMKVCYEDRRPKAHTAQPL